MGQIKGRKATRQCESVLNTTTADGRPGYTSDSSKTLRGGTPGAFGEYLINRETAMNDRERRYSVETRWRGTDRVRVIDSADRKWISLGKKVRAGARI